MKFLVDECLSTELVLSARAAGFVESTHVSWLGLGGKRDIQLMVDILAGGWTFVTSNAICFDHAGPMVAARYKSDEMVEGAVCLYCPLGLGIDRQAELFNVALQKLAEGPSIIHQCLEVSTLGGGLVKTRRYALPPGSYGTRRR